MKKTTTISLAKTLYHIEEDAYALLDTYLTSIREHFAHHADKKEILSDIESRIAERFSETPDAIITVETVQSVIDAMGTIGQFDTDEQSDATADQKSKRLYRDPDGRMLAGVASGLAYYFGIDATIVRLLFVASIFFGGLGGMFYIILWAVTPVARTSAQKLEMRGESVTLKAMSEMVKDRFDEIDGERIKGGAKNVGHAMEHAFQGVFRVIRAVFGVFVTLGALVATAVLTVLATLALFRLPETIFGPTATPLLHGPQYSIAVVSLYLIIVLPVIIVLLWGISILGRKGLLNRINVLVFGSLWFIAIIAAGVTVTRLAYKVNEAVSNDPAVIVQTISQPLAPFTAINVADAKRVTFVQGDEYKIEYNGVQSLIDQTSAVVTDGTLEISGKDSEVMPCMFCNRGSLSITVTAPSLSSVGAQDAARFDADDIKMVDLNILAADASRVSITGMATTLVVSAEDAARFEGSGLQVRSARVSSHDMARVYVNADTILVTDAYDASRIEYSDSPELSIKKHDAARVEPAGNEE